MDNASRPIDWTDMDDGTHAASWSDDNRWYIEHDRPGDDEPWVAYYCDDLGDVITDIDTFPTLDRAKLAVMTGAIESAVLMRLEEMVVGAARCVVAATTAARAATRSHDHARAVLASAMAGMCLATA